MDDASQRDFYYKGICLFCGKLAEVEYFSGTVQTYIACKCESRLKFYKIRHELYATRKEADALYEKMKLIEAIEKAESELEYLKRKMKE